jgi:hypothetical protein
MVAPFSVDAHIPHEIVSKLRENKIRLKTGNTYFCFSQLEHNASVKGFVSLQFS